MWEVSRYPGLLSILAFASSYIDAAVPLIKFDQNKVSLNSVVNELSNIVKGSAIFNLPNASFCSSNETNKLPTKLVLTFLNSPLGFSPLITVSASIFLPIASAPNVIVLAVWNSIKTALNAIISLTGNIRFWRT